jgi:hypothetical protein
LQRRDSAIVVPYVDHHPKDSGTYYPYAAQDQSAFQPQVSYFFIHTAFDFDVDVDFAFDFDFDFD